MSCKVVVVNAAKMDFDGKLDFSVLSDDVQVFADSSEEELLQRIQGADVVVTKELSHIEIWQSHKCHRYVQQPYPLIQCIVFQMLVPSFCSHICE